MYPVRTPVEPPPPGLAPRQGPSAWPSSRSGEAPPRPPRRRLPNEPSPSLEAARRPPPSLADSRGDDPSARQRDARRDAVCGMAHEAMNHETSSYGEQHSEESALDRPRPRVDLADAELVEPIPQRAEGEREDPR